MPVEAHPGGYGEPSGHSGIIDPQGFRQGRVGIGAPGKLHPVRPDPGPDVQVGTRLPLILTVEAPLPQRETLGWVGHPVRQIEHLVGKGCIASQIPEVVEGIDPAGSWRVEMPHRKVPDRCADRDMMAPKRTGKLVLDLEQVLRKLKRVGGGIVASAQVPVEEVAFVGPPHADIDLGESGGSASAVPRLLMLNKNLIAPPRSTPCHELKAVQNRSVRPGDPGRRHPIGAQGTPVGRKIFFRPGTEMPPREASVF